MLCRMTPVTVFDDALETLTPLTDLRASFLVRTGALTTLDRARRTLPPLGMTVAGVRVPPLRAPLTSEQTDAPVNKPITAESVLLNGRCVIPPDAIATLPCGSGILGEGGALVAARLNAKDAEAFLASRSLPSSIKLTPSAARCLLERPWDVIRFRDAAIAHDLRLMLGDIAHETAAGSWREVPAEEGVTTSAPGASSLPGVILINPAVVCIHATARISPGVVLDAEAGPIVVDEGGIIRPGSVIVGPAYIGKHSTVLERSLIKPHTAIGPVCKVAGEVGGTIFQGYANKGHDGHLGDSWVGEWANFGAGTTNSNLLNTYGEVTAALTTPGASRERTGLQYLGCIVGDHTKFAICTRIMTGSIFGTGCMVATTKPPPTSVPPFSWLTDERTQPYRFSKFLDVAKTVMARRKLVPTAPYEAALRSLVKE